MSVNWETEAEFWCRLLGMAVDALDDLSADDEPFREDQTRAEDAAQYAEEIRSHYRNRPVPRS